MSIYYRSKRVASSNVDDRYILRKGISTNIRSEKRKEKVVNANVGQKMEVKEKNKDIEENEKAGHMEGEDIEEHDSRYMRF